MKTAHRDRVKKLMCPHCQKLIGTITNLAVHIKRAHKIHVKVENKKINGRNVTYKYIDKNKLKNGRLYSDLSSSDSESDLLLADLQQKMTRSKIMEPEIIIDEFEWPDLRDQFEYSGFNHNDAIEPPSFAFDQSNIDTMTPIQLASGPLSTQVMNGMDITGDFNEF